MSLEVTHHRVRANGLDQHYVTAGEGPPVVLLHGFPEIPALATDDTVIAPDLRGMATPRRRTPATTNGRWPRTSAN